jgi:hypothetical protein
MTTHRSPTISFSDSAFASPRREPDQHGRNCPPHTWDCPVLTKLDPLAIAWTCADCGAIATAPVGAPRPANGAAAVTAG